jgi:hypothetical protein
VLCALASTAAAEDIRVDCGRPAGRIKAIHGVNNGPLANGENAKLGRWYAEAGFPVARLHDVRWPSPDACDVSTIFPLAHLDPATPGQKRRVILHLVNQTEHLLDTERKQHRFMNNGHKGV